MYGDIEQGLRCIQIIWSVDDVKIVRPDLTEAECLEVLEEVLLRHNAEIGVNRQVIEIYAEELFPKREQSGGSRKKRGWQKKW